MKLVYRGGKYGKFLLGTSEYFETRKIWEFEKKGRNITDTSFKANSSTAPLPNTRTNFSLPGDVD